MDSEQFNLARKNCENGDADSCLLIGDYFLDEVNDLEEAMSFFEKARLLGHLLADRRIGFVSFHLNDFEKARSSWLVAARNNDYHAFFNLGILEYEEGNLQLAEGHFMNSLTVGSEKTFFDVGEFFYHNKDHARAIKFLIRGNINGDYSCAELLARIYEENGNREEAKSVYQSNISSENPYFLTQLGRLNMEDNKWETAAPLLEKACNLGVGGACLVVGDYYNKQGDILKAEEYLLKAIDLDDSDALIELGKLEMYRGRTDHALSYFKRAVDKGNGYACYELGCYYSKVDKLHESIFWHEKSLILGNTLSYYSLGFIHSEKFEYEKATKYFEKHIECGYRGGYGAIGSIEYRLGNIENAKIYYLKGIEEGDLYSYFNLSEIELLYGHADLGLKYANYVLDSDNLRLRIQMCSTLSSFFEKKGDSDSFMKYQKLMHELTTSLDDTSIHICNLS